MKAKKFSISLKLASTHFDISSVSQTRKVIYQVFKRICQVKPRMLIDKVLWTERPFNLLSF